MLAEIEIDLNCQKSELDDYAEYNLSYNVNDISYLSNAVSAINDFLLKHNAKIVSAYIFYGADHTYAIEDVFLKGLQQSSVPLVKILAKNPSDPISIQIKAVSNIEVCYLKEDNGTVGAVYECNDLQYCYLSGLVANDAVMGEEEQTRFVYKKAKQLLELEGFEVTDIIRTWYYLSDILSWYDAFNNVRTDFFEQDNVFDVLVPASTGIGAKLVGQNLVLLSLLAVKKINDNVRIEPIRSPLQCSAMDYKASFSRAVEIQSSNKKELYVSGTASIDNLGKTVHVNEINHQIQKTFSVVEELLRSRKYDRTDASRMIVYYKNYDVLNSFLDYIEHNKWKVTPSFLHSDICRDDLLFEIELDAVKTQNND